MLNYEKNKPNNLALEPCNAIHLLKSISLLNEHRLDGWLLHGNQQGMVLLGPDKCVKSYQTWDIFWVREKKL